MENKVIKFRAWDKDRNEMDYCGIERIGSYHEPMENPIMQFGGLLDKEKVEIYEGDVIEYIGCDGKRYYQECPSLFYYHFWQELEDNETKLVIGNIYKTPKLV